jgi:cyclic beta-1,2-glucan synthetase
MSSSTSVAASAVQSAKKSVADLQRLVPDAAAVLCELLNAAWGPPGPPIRSEIFGAQRFAQHGRSLAETHRTTLSSSRGVVFFPRLQENMAVLRRAHSYIGSQAATGYDISPAAEWLLDNFHLIEAQVKEIHDGLPRRFFLDLPVLRDEPLMGLPRIYSVAWAFVAHTDGAFNEGLLTHYLSAYQEVHELNLGEMWALPTTLRVVLLENLRRLAERVAIHKGAREVANLCSDRIEAYAPHTLEALLALLNRRGLGQVFLAQMSQRLQGRRTGEFTAVRDWLQLQMPQPALVLAQQSADQAADNLSVSNAVSSLRAIGDADWSSIVSGSSALMRLMLTLPIFEAEDSPTRDQTLHRIEQLAKKTGRSELEVAQALVGFLKTASDPPDSAEQPTSPHSPHYWLRGPGRSELMRSLGAKGGQRWPARAAWFWQAMRDVSGRRQRVTLWVYAGSLMLGTVVLLMWALRGHDPALSAAWPGFSRSGMAWFWSLNVALMFLPASEAVVAIVNRLISESVEPQRLPRLALLGGIPAEHRVLVVIPTMLTESSSTHSVVHRLHLHHLANPEAHSQFALLSDWADASTPHTNSDAPLLDEACALVSDLNRRYPAHHGDAPRFIVLHRQRQYSESEGAWIGWERKRGKLELLVAVMSSEPPKDQGQGFIDLGELSRVVPRTPYLLTLDSDTELPPGRLRELVGIAAHPSNRPQLHANGLRVRSGYGIIQPRVVTPLPSPAQATPFHWLFAGQCGNDPYTAASSEVYQDLFGEGTFSGKGLLNVAAVHAVLGNRLPHSQVLSHDLLEGSLARCASATDLTVMEDAPFHADVAESRLHRWTRGDWQLLPFLLQPGRYPMRTINRWKMFDNLRRSLVWPACLALCVLMLSGGMASPKAVLALIVAAFCAGPFMGAVAGLAPSHDGIAKWYFYRNALIEVGRALGGGLWHFSQLLAHALSSSDAIVRALWRMLASHKKLLQWTTAAAAQAAAQTELGATVRAHSLASALALALWAVLMLTGTPHPVLTTLFCSLWALAPVGTWWVSKARKPRSDNALTASDKTNLEAIARASWRLFERCVGPEDKHLPPDNFQTEPSDMVAHRTSPTNIGMYLLSAACARQFGWIGTADFLQRLDATLGTLDTLERHHGHFLNWYDTQTGLALLPRYVSTVDSGNLSGHLLAVAQACREFATHSATEPPVWRTPKASMLTTAVELRVLDNALKEISLQNLSDLELATLRTTLTDAAAWQLDDHVATLRSAAVPSASTTLSIAAQLRAMADRCETLAWQPNFNFLYHPSRRLLHLGWRVDERTLDNSFYDLLASESRLASLIAIAKADVPAAHWGALGRPFHAVGSSASLRSWSGSMFEYLMPTLVLAEPPGSVLHNACRAAVTEHITYGRVQKLPWGISESAYAARDQTLAYQYAPQGVPQLALRRTPPEDQVVAPYATGLAAMVVPHLAVQNFAVMAKLGATARYGFIESLDFSPSRVAEAQNPASPNSAASAPAFTPVHTFMAHHQGMTIVALANVLLNSAAQRWGMAHPQIQAIASLLHERPPREVPSNPDLPLGMPQQALKRRAPGLLREVLPGDSALAPTHVLSNGRYSVSLRANGAGQSRRGGVGINRWRDDALRDSMGSFFYVRRKSSGSSVPSAAAPSASSLVSITQHPAPDPEAQYTSTFHTDRVCFDAAWPELRAHATVWVSPEDDIEFRQVELHNQSDEAIEIELISAFEVTLADQRADEAHPAFSNFFVSAEWRPHANALVFERRPRLEHERGLCMAHFLAFVDGASMANRGRSDQASNTVLTELKVEAARAHWQGRNRSACQPLGQLRTGPQAESGSNAPPAQVLDTELDPVCAMSVSLRIAARSQARLTFATAASENMGTLNAVVDKYRQPSNVQRASLMSATLMGIRLRSLRLSTENFSAIQSLTSALVMTLASPERPATPTPGSEPDTRPVALPPVYDKRLLWRMGISGDRPLILVFAGVAQGLGLLRTLTQALRLWSWGGVACDLVVVNAEAASYQMALHREIGALRDRHAADSAADARMTDDSSGHTAAPLTALHLLRAEEVSPGELSTLHGLARIVLQADGRPLVHHLQAWTERHEAELEARNDTSTTAVPVLQGNTPVRVSQGEFASADEADPGAFRFDVSSRQRPPRPWINVLANPDFGCHLSEAGGGHTWALNSRMNQLTAWHNDPLGDPASQWLLLQDRRSGSVWSAAPSVHAAAEVTYQVTHTQGSTQIQHQRSDATGKATVTVTWCVDAQDSVKHITVHIRNDGPRKLHWRLAAGVEWLMGATPADRRTAYTEKLRGTATTTTTNGPASSSAPYTGLLCTQREHSGGFGGGRAFFALVPSAVADVGFTQALFDAAEDSVIDWTCDRREFFDARGRFVLPDHLGHRSGAGLDPCAALSINLDLASGAQSTHTFLMGYVSNAHLEPSAARDAVARAVRKTSDARAREVRLQWQQLLHAVQVKTPDPLFDSLVNHWLLYQTVSCRMWAKAGFYQAGGASGFRDQLQDAMALSWAAPDMLRAQILRCAARQYPEGDVQHWWHAPGGAGVRTHFSDDLLWLPWACAHYANSVGDLNLLDTLVPFIEGAPIPPGAEDIYETPRVSTQTAMVYEHAARSLDRSMAVGAHGLPLMGTGDWNDGMNRVGHEGKGESVWLAWFLCKVVADFSPLASARGELERVEKWQRAAEGWTQALEAQAWDGAWYKRAFFDDGSPLGSAANTEARIDLIAQAWAVLSNAAPLARQQAAMASARSQLIDDRSGLLHLLQPPLQSAIPSAGYIQAYPPGVRENGGQYSHGAVWALMAQAQLNVATAGSASANSDLPYRYFTYLSPAHRAAHSQWGAAYELEPYVMAGDVYGHAPYEGRGGWSWYTGAAAWMHRAAVESIFGLKLSAAELTITPCLPLHWDEAEISLKRDGNTLRFVLCRGSAAQWMADHADAQAQTLAVGASLRWADLAWTAPQATRCFVTELV